MSGEKDSLIHDRYVDLVVAAANHPDARWQLRGSSDWANRPGRLTVEVELDEEEWDEVYDRLDSAGNVVNDG